MMGYIRLWISKRLLFTTIRKIILLLNAFTHTRNGVDFKQTKN